jgi:hypothetical protein
VLGDTSRSFWAYEATVFAPWPDDRVDSRVTTIARADPGVKCDFHDIDIVGDRAVVLAESSLRLLNVPLRATAWPVPMAKCAGRSHFLVGYSMLRNRSAMRCSI